MTSQPSSANVLPIEPVPLNNSRIRILHSASEKAIVSHFFRVATMPRGAKAMAKSKNAARRNRLPPPPPLSGEDKLIKLYLSHVSRGHPDVTTIRIAYDARIGALRHAICLLEGYRGVTLLDGVRQLDEDNFRLIDYELFDGDVVCVVDNSVAYSTAASSSAASSSAARA